MNKFYLLVLILFLGGCNKTVSDKDKADSGKLYLREFVFPVEEALDQTVVYLTDIVYDNSNSSDQLYQEYNAYLLGSDTLLVKETYLYSGNNYGYQGKGSSIYSNNGTIIIDDSLLLNKPVLPKFIGNEAYSIDYIYSGEDTIHMQSTYNIVYEDCSKNPQKMLNVKTHDLNGQRAAEINRKSAKGIGTVCGSVALNIDNERISWQERFNRRLSSKEMEEYFTERDQNLLKHSTDIPNKELSFSEILTGSWCWGKCSGTSTWSSYIFQDDGIFISESYTPFMNFGDRYIHGRWFEIGDQSVRLIYDYDSNNQYLTGTESIGKIESNTEIIIKGTPYTKINE